MNRGWARTLALASLLPLTASLGCDALTVHSFAGTVMELTISGVTATTLQPDQHLELWARTQYNDIVRIPGYTDLNAGETAFGIMLRQAISLDDPCMIDGYYFPKNPNGNLLTSAAAYPGGSTAGGVMQTDQQLAQQVIDRINQLTDPKTGASAPLFAVLPYDPAVPPVIPMTATSEERRTACDMFTGKGSNTPNKLAYVGNPYQITAPLNGTVYGFQSFVSTKPPANYDGYRIDTPINLKGVQEIFFTVEGPTVDPMNPGPLFLISQRTLGGQDVVHFALVHADPASTVSGSAALLVDLDEDPVQF